MVSSRRTYARVFLSQIQQNYHALREAVGPAAEVLCVVKADAYGHGAVPVARALSQAGASRFAVACADEAVELREASVEGELLVLTGIDAGEAACARAQRLTPVLHTWDQLEAWRREAAEADTPLPCHVELNTGMNRMGFDAASGSEVERLAEGLAACRELRLEGIATHLAAAEDFCSPQTEQQMERFRRAVERFREKGLAPRYLHAANSSAAAYRPDTRGTMVRPGLALYGYLPGAKGEPLSRPPRLLPALEWKARLLAVREVAAGALLGYNGTFVASRPLRAGVVSVGYADGFARAMSNGGEVEAGGRRCPVVGLVSMDVTLVDLTNAPQARPGDEVTLIGDGIDAEAMARRCGTVVYESLCRISRRVPRIYEGASAETVD